MFIAMEALFSTMITEHYIMCCGGLGSEFDMNIKALDIHTSNLMKYKYLLSIEKIKIKIHVNIRMASASDLVFIR